MKFSPLIEFLAVMSCASSAVARIGEDKDGSKNSRELITVPIGGTELAGSGTAVTIGYTWDLFHKNPYLCWDGGNADAKTVYWDQVW